MQYCRRSDASSRVTFTIPRDYTVHTIIGKGAYGVVCAATHKPSGQEIAIKKLVPFRSTTTCLRMLRELKLLRHFDHENIVSLLDVPKPLSYDSFTEVYLVQELMPSDLHKAFSIAILKPANLLVNERCDLKICDFGLARADANRDDRHGFMTEYVATRWYRAPEVMLTFKQYTSAIDIWSTGCILAEMMFGKPLFPGRDYHHQLVLIFNILGSPTEEDYRAIKSWRAKDYIRHMQLQKKTPWNFIFPNATAIALDLLDRLVAFNPEKRITVEDALKHPYVDDYHDPEDEPTSERVAEELLSFDRDQEPLSKEQMKRLMFDEIMREHRPIRDQSGGGADPYLSFHQRAMGI